MLLAIDVGNTNTVLGLYRLADTKATPETPVTLLADWRITTQRNITTDEFGVLFRNLFNLRSLDMAAVTGIAISSVVPPLDTILRRATDLYFHVKPLFVEPGTRTGLPIHTDNPAEVGADRIVNCVAAFDRFRDPSPAQRRLRPSPSSSSTWARPPPSTPSPPGASSSAEPSPPASASPPTPSSPAPPASPASTSASPARSSAPTPSTTSRSASTTATSAWSMESLPA